MLFPDDALFDYVKLDLAETLATLPTVIPQPMTCDRWIARSALQKAIRRGEVAIAQHALANLFAQDPAAVWRHLVIICAEDVGVANMDLLAQIIAARKDRKWRNQMGGDWPVLCGLVHIMAASIHCQAACDLLLMALNHPGLELDRADVLDAEPSQLAAAIANEHEPLERRAIAALAMAGCLADGQTYADPCGVFDLLSELGHFSHVVATCRAGWKLSRNPMLLLLTPVWQAHMQHEDCAVSDDRLPTTNMIGDVPGYALDQFTREGNRINRAYLAQDEQLTDLLNRAGVEKGAHVRTLGDVLFLIEGGLVRHQLIWPVAERLRRPHRWLPAVALLGPNLPPSFDIAK